MNRFLKNRSFPYVSSTLAATVISIAAALLFVPVVATPHTPIEHSKSSNPSDGHLYHLSPIPAGADWARS
jgi:hypothetical protein